jgi:hypothetical protein
MCFLSGYYGVEMWLNEYEVFGFPATRASHILLYVLFAILALSTLD